MQKALIRSGPRAAPLNGKTAARALMVLGLLAAGLVSWVAKQEIKWEQATAHLDAEPGLKVTASSLRWGIREVEGLRDVNAEDPAVVLRRR